MTDEKLTEHRHHSLLSKRLAMPEQHHRHQCFVNNEISQSCLSPSVPKPAKSCWPSSPLMNIKNPLTAFNYKSIFRPIMPFDASQSLTNNNHYDSTNTLALNQPIESKPFHYPADHSGQLSEETAVLKINIPIEMIVRNLPQQLLSSSPEQQYSAVPPEQYDHRHNYSGSPWSTKQTPCHAASEWSSKPGTSFIRKAQEAFFGANMHNDRGDVSSKLTRRADLPVSDTYAINEMSKSVPHQQQYTTKSFQKSSQGPSNQPLISQYSESSSYSCPKRCQCRSTLYSSM